MFNNTQHLSTTLLLCAALSTSTISQAEEIHIPIGQQAQNEVAIDMPSKGMSKDRVKSLFGEPIKTVTAKGQPPITHWKYQEFTVYFDSNTVIHCVRHFKPQVDVKIQPQ